MSIEWIVIDENSQEPLNIKDDERMLCVVQKRKLIDGNEVGELENELAFLNYRHYQTHSGWVYKETGYHPSMAGQKVTHYSHINNLMPMGVLK